MLKRIIYLCLLCMACLTGYADSYKLTTTTTSGGYINVYGLGSDGKVEAGRTVTININTYDRYELVSLTENGVAVDYGTEFRYTMPSHDVTFSLVTKYTPTLPSDPGSLFGETHVLTASCEPYGAGYIRIVGNGESYYSSTSTDSIAEGDSRTVYYITSNNYVFVGWKRDGQIFSTDNPLSYVMGTADDAISAVMKFQVTPPSDPGSTAWDSESGELYLSNFTKGQLYYSLQKYSSDAVSVILSGEMNGGANDTNQDFFAFGEQLTWSNLTTIDLSETYGYEAIPKNSFLGANFPELQKVILPSGVKYIDGKAFSDCDSLAQVYCYATQPPVLGNMVFANVPSSMEVYVPQESMVLYQNAVGWRNFTIMAIPDADARSIQVNLPEDCGTKYNGMTLRLLNEQDASQVYDNIINDRESYIYKNLRKNYTYKAQLISKQGDILAEIAQISVADASQIVTFTDVKSILSPSLMVKTPEGEDVTAKTTISWIDAKGNYIKQAASISGIVEGSKLFYTITLPEELAREYQLIGKGSVEVTSSDPITVNLKAIETTTLSGKVQDTDGNSLTSAVVTVSQNINNLYSSSSVSKVATDGSFSAAVKYGTLPTGESWGGATIDVSADGYIAQSRTVAIDDLSVPQTFTLKSITGATVTLKLSYQESVESTKPAQQVSGYSDYENISYSIENITKGTEIKDFNVQYPDIVLLESVDNGDEIRVTATSRDNSFNTVSGTCQIAETDSKQTATANILIIGRGGVKSSYITTDNARVVAVLYDANGNMIKKSEYVDKAVEFTGLEDGNYSLVSMAYSDLYNDFSTLSTLENAGLKDYTDYLLKSFTVKSGVIKTVVNQVIPFFDETKVYYTGSMTSFTSNKSTVTAGNSVTLKAKVDFKSKYSGSVSNVKVIFDLPQSISYLNGSVMVGSAINQGISIDGNRYTVALNNLEDEVRICATPSLGGDYTLTAYVQFTYNNKTVLQPIGNVPLTVKDLSINVPSKTAKPAFSVSGTAKADAEVTIYDGNTVLGKTTAKANGSWAAVVTLLSPEQGSWHSIYGKAVKDDEQLYTETKRMQYDEDAMYIKEVHMYHNNPEMGKTYDLKFDFQNPSNKPGYYTYYIYNKQFTFSLTAEMKTITDVTLNVITSKGQTIPLTMTYDQRTGKYVASGDFGNYYDGNLPVNVTVTTESFGTIPSNNRDANFGIDPSGYVYEAVKSNRVKGATATIYYRKDADSAEEIWDASGYEQENPVTTDDDGMYRWDVPEGQWQVRLEKEGYNDTQSEWLPVPPPQLDINLPMVNPSAPTVTSVKAFSGEQGVENGAVEIEFSKYMKTSTLLPGYITLTIDGASVLSDEGFTYPDQEETDGIYYARKVRVPANKVFSTNDKPTLCVTTGVESYAGTNLAETFTQEQTITKEVKEIVVNDVQVLYDPYSEEPQTAKITVSVSPADAGFGKTLRAVSASDMMATVTSEATLDSENGQAELTVRGLMPGQTTLAFTIDGEAVTGTCNVYISRNARKVAAPVATKATGTAVYNNSSIVISSSTDDARIYYTTDGSKPTTETATIYEEPILMNKAMTIRAFAAAEGYDNSDTVQFVYTIKQAEGTVALAEGWNWMSHNLEGTMSVSDISANAKIERVISPTAELFNDPSWGLVGNLTELTNDMCYKVQTNGTGSIACNGNAADALSTPISLKAGWNWIGYPVGQSASVSEAFAYAQPSCGDKIVNLEGGQAEYDGMTWNGDLTTLTPGHGYQYYANSPFTFWYNSNIVSNAAAKYAVKRNPVNTPWTCNVHAYADVMCVVADVYADGSKTDAGTYNVAAFCGDECRGIGIYAGGKLMLTVHGKSGDQITFRAVTSDNVTEYAVSETMKFGDTIQGTLAKPATLTIDATTGVKTVKATDSVIADKCYDLSGKRVNGNSAKGVIISNGTKIVK